MATTPSSTKPNVGSPIPFDSATGEPAPVEWRLRLYVAGQSPKSLQAIVNLTRLCEEHLESRYDIEVVDLVENPQLAAGDEIIAIPTLVRRLPGPVRRFIGDLSDADRVLVGLKLTTVVE